MAAKVLTGLGDERLFQSFMREVGAGQAYGGWTMDAVGVGGGRESCICTAKPLQPLHAAGRSRPCAWQGTHPRLPFTPHRPPPPHPIPPHPIHHHPQAAILRDMRDRNIVQFVGICMGAEEEGIPDEAMLVGRRAPLGGVGRLPKGAPLGGGTRAPQAAQRCAHPSAAHSQAGGASSQDVVPCGACFAAARVASRGGPLQPLPPRLGATAQGCRCPSPLCLPCPFAPARSRSSWRRAACSRRSSGGTRRGGACLAGGQGGTCRGGRLAGVATYGVGPVAAR